MAGLRFPRESVRFVAAVTFFLAASRGLVPARTLGRETLLVGQIAGAESLFPTRDSDDSRERPQDGPTRLKALGPLAPRVAPPPSTNAGDRGAAGLRRRIETPEGVLIVYDAAMPPDAPRASAGYLAWWRPLGERYIYVYDRLLFTAADLHFALADLTADFEVDDHPVLTGGPFDNEDVAGPDDVGRNWPAANRRLVLRIMGFDDLPAADDDSDDDRAPLWFMICDWWEWERERTHSHPQGPLRTVLIPPPADASPDDIIRIVLDEPCVEGPPPHVPPDIPPDGCPHGDPCCVQGENCCDDLDCDGIPDPYDPDVDGDGIPNDTDTDDDNDGIPDPDDPTPCRGSCCLDNCCQSRCCPGDVDCDGIPNPDDPDIDGDGILNWDDPDTDGDGIPNANDNDDDSDGTPDSGDDSPEGCGGGCCGLGPCCGVECDDGDPCTADVCDNGACEYCCVPTRGQCSCSANPTFTLKEIRFGNDHIMHENAAPGGWGAGPPYDGADWTDENNPDHPICYTRGAPMRITVWVEVRGQSAGTGTLKVSAVDGLVGTAEIGVSCGTSTRVVTIETTSLPDYVWRYQPLYLNWSVRPSAGSSFVGIRQTAHHLFVSYGTPTFADPANDPPTQRRMQTLTGLGLDESDPLTITNNIHESLNTPDWIPPLNPLSVGVSPPWVGDWRLMSGVPFAGECHDQAHLMNLMMKMLGLPAGIEDKIYASTDSDPSSKETTTAAALGITIDLDGDGTAGDTDELLELIFDFDPPNGNWNNFEGYVFTLGKYYAVWPSLVADSACRLLLRLRDDPEVEARQYWVYPLIGAPTYWQEVPFPTCP